MGKKFIKKLDVISLWAHAKVNLNLQVGKKRKDGFHEIDTIMQSISLGDELMLVRREDGKEIRLQLRQAKGLSRVPGGPANLAYRAARLFREQYYRKQSYRRRELSSSFDVTITLKKQIPVGAGLAGGSADAAAVLYGLNKLYGEPFSTLTLLKLAAMLGSDVPFCLVGGRARCRGRGERISILHPMRKRWLVLVKPTLAVSTPWAYQMLDQARVAQLGKEEESVRWKQGNDFELVLLAQLPRLARLKAQLASLGFPNFQMSGSGPTFFSFMKNEQRAHAAVAHLSSHLPKRTFIGAFYTIPYGVRVEST